MRTLRLEGGPESFDVRIIDEATGQALQYVEQIDVHVRAGEMARAELRVWAPGFEQLRVRWDDRVPHMREGESCSAWWERVTPLLSALLGTRQPWDMKS